MKTIQAIKLLLEDCRQRIDRIVALTKKDYGAQVKEEIEVTMERLKNLYMLFPDLMPVNDTDNMTPEDVQHMIENLENRVEGKYSAHLLPTGNVLCDEICGYKIVTPAFSAWQGGTAKEGNFVISYGKSEVNDAEAALSYLIENMILALPIKRVHLNFVTLNYATTASGLMKKLDKSLFDFISDTKELDTFCSNMDKRMQDVLQNCGGDLVSYNDANKTMLYPYEVVVLMDYPNETYEYSVKKLNVLLENGHKGGIYFVIMNNTDNVVDRSTLQVKMDDLATPINLKAFAKANPVSRLDDGVIGKAFIKYLSEKAKKKLTVKAVKADFATAYKEPYAEVDGDLEIPVGVEPGGDVANFILNDSADHCHCFIIGSTGSGKSSFLHSIAMGAMMKYSPQDIQFYIMDFKQGIEFGAYKDSKHVKALLINNQDLQITVEILRDLAREVNERSKLFTSTGNKQISTYNRANPENRKPHIVLMVDECQEMFKSTMDNSAMYREISTLIQTIAHQGRAYGIHLILATQTLANTEISSDILNDIKDRYLLQCAPSDAERLIEGASRTTSFLSVGQVYTKNFTEEKVFQSYFIKETEAIGLVKDIARKAGEVPGFKQFCFNGAQEFVLTQDMIDDISAERYNVASLGRSIDLSLSPVNIQLRKDDAENILFLGLDQDNVTRTVMNALVSLVQTAKNNGRILKTYVLHFNEEGSYIPTLNRLQKDGLIEVVDNNRDASDLLVRLAGDVIAENVQPTLLVILGQQSMRILGRAIKQAQKEVTSNLGSDSMSFDDFNMSFSDDTEMKTYGDALEKIIECGPYLGLNTLLQVDRPKKVLLKEYVNQTYINTMFNHVVALQSDAGAATELGIDVKLDRLSADQSRLRAIYHNYAKDKSQTFTPFILK